MVPKKEKRKKKQILQENDNEDTTEKYLAYVIKPKKGKISTESDPVASTSRNDFSTENKKVQKKQLKNQVEKGDSSSTSQTDSDSPLILSISAKPKLYQDTSKLKATKVSAKKMNGLKGKKTSTSQKVLGKTKANSKVDEASGIEIITPIETMDPVDKDGNIIPMRYPIPNKYEYDIEYEDNYDYSMKPVVYEAHLKKPTSYYIPSVLRDEKQKKSKSKTDKNFAKRFESMNINIAESITETSDTNDEEDSCTEVDLANATKNSEAEPSSTSNTRQSFNTGCNDESNSENNSNTDLNVTPNEEQDPNADIPQALKDFYEEVTQRFENHVNKSSKSRNKWKVKSVLTVDNSVGDEKTLSGIISRNTSQLENTVSTYQPNIAKFFSLQSKVILVLCPGTQFSFLGKLKIKILYGAIELYGSLFNPQNTLKPIEVYSPRGQSSISILTSNSNGMPDKEALWDALTAEGVDRSLKTKLHDAIQECKENWSVLLLENFDNTLTNFLNSFSSYKLFPKIDNIRYSWCDPKRAECVLQAYFQFTSSVDEISIGPQWNENVTKQLIEQWQLTKSMIAIITGGKNVGKSTTAKYLINNLLRHSEKVVLLDLDPGQAEMTPAGCVSLNIIDKPLLGPNFSHLRIPFYQLYLEDVNVTNCMTRYIDCAKKLVECLKSNKNLLQYPVIVNTMGFCKGIGLDIIIFLIKLIQPSNVVQILSKRPKNNFDSALVKQFINEKKTSSILWEDNNAILENNCEYELHYVPSVAEGKRQFESWNMEPRQQRELVLLSYLSQIISNADDKNFCNFTSNSINNIAPYTLAFSSFYITLIKSNISPTHILAAMNGNIVALCGADLDDEIPQEDKEALNYPMVVIQPPLCTCYGYGIVRGIDMKRRQLYINTPLRESELRHVNLLAGCNALPFSLLHSDAPYAGDKGELPTSRKPRRGNYRVDQNRSA